MRLAENNINRLALLEMSKREHFQSCQHTLIFPVTFSLEKPMVTVPASLAVCAKVLQSLHGKPKLKDRFILVQNFSEVSV